MTANKNVITADEIAECLGVSKSSAYKIMLCYNKIVTPISEKRRIIKE